MTIVERIQKRLDPGSYAAEVFGGLKKTFGTVDLT